MKLNWKLWVAILLVVVAVVMLIFPEIREHISLTALKERQHELQAHFASSPVRTAAYYVVFYTVFVAISLPGAVILTLAGGAIFGALWGTILVSFASTIGATLAFLIARFVLDRTIRSHFEARFARVSEGFNRDGAFYLFTLRLVPVFPFFVINILMGLTSIRVPVFFFVSQAGMLPATFVYVYAGTELSKIDSVDDILSPGILTAFILLGLLPLITRKSVQYLQMMRARS